MKNLNFHTEDIQLPDFFKPILWSYDFSAMNPKKQSKTIIINAINYGNLNHWRWIIKYYGKDKIKEILQKIPTTEIKPKTRRLAEIIFSIDKFNYVPRSANGRGQETFSSSEKF
ncbi:MAG: hypothetical protein V1698_02965 [bacterium]